jgi:dolichol-phosphate mannosyltransferase
MRKPEKPVREMRVAVVIPCYRVADNVLQVVAQIPACVERIYCVDDACPQKSGDLIAAQCRDDRVKVVRHLENRGVGGAMVTGYAQAIADGFDVLVKIDGDGQMDPSLIPRFVRPIQDGLCDYSKGNRFFNFDDVRTMPSLRLFGNLVLGFMTKLSSGYWHVFDPNNGYTALHAAVAAELRLDKLAQRYFFEADILFRLRLLNAVVLDVPMVAKYGNESSSLAVHRVVLPFLAGHFRNFVKRLLYSYFLRDFTIASLGILLGIPMLLWGLGFGIVSWQAAAALGQAATSGTVMLATLPIILGTQFVLSALQYDIASVPVHPLHPILADKARPQTGVARPDPRSDRLKAWIGS